MSESVASCVDNVIKGVGFRRLFLKSDSEHPIIGPDCCFEPLKAAVRMRCGGVEI